MKRIYITLIGLFLVSTNLTAQSLNERIAVPLTSPGERGTLEIGLVGGSITVKGYQGKEVIIDAVGRENRDDDDGHKHGRHHDEDKDDRRKGLKRIASSPLEIEVVESDNRVSVESNSWKQPIDFTVQVPSNFDLELSTVNNGDITVENVRGNLELNNVNGEITAIDVGGSAIIDTVNGKIEASFTSVNVDSPMAFTTLNGDVDLSLPSNIKAVLKMKSDQGEIYSDFDMNVGQSGPQVNRSNKGGFKVTIENWVFGSINGGGPEFLINNMNGNIYIRKSN